MATLQMTTRSGFIALLAATAMLLGPAYGQFDSFGFGFDDPLAEPIKISAQFTAPTGDRPAILMVTAEMGPGYHVYSLTQPKTDQGEGPMRTQVRLNPSDQYRQIGSFASFPEHKSHIDKYAWPGLELQEQSGRVTWYIPIELTGTTPPEAVEITGRVVGQVCKDSCIQVKEDFVAKLGSGVPIGQLVMTQAPVDSGASANPSSDFEPLAPSGQLGDPGASYELQRIELEKASGSLFKFLGLAFLGGLILNLMPCVLPVIGLKIMSFMEQAGHSRSQALTLNLWYSAGILLVFLILAALAITIGLSWGEQFGSAAFNIVMAAIVFAMGLSLLGVWEIPIPGFLGHGSAQKAASQEGRFGALLKGVITTLLATPCTGPGMATALGWAVKQPPQSVVAVFTAMGLGMASPYLVIGAFPELVRFLPKPGAWMEKFKQIMGFILMGTVVFLLTLLPAPSLVPTIALLTGIAFACWIYAQTPISASSFDKSQTWGLCSAVVIGSAVFSFAWLEPALAGSSGTTLQWREFSLAALKQTAVEDKKTVLVDFSANWCWNCKVLEKAVLHTESVEDAIRDAGVVTMYADNSDYPPEIEQTIEALGSDGVPVIAIFPGNDPYRPIVFRGAYTRRQIIQAVKQATEQQVESVAKRPVPLPVSR